MYKYFPLLLVGGIVGIVSAILILAYALVKNKKESMGFDRQMKDGEIIKRLMQYGKPYRKQFLFVGFLMLFSIAYDIVAPLIVGNIEELIVGDFQLNRLFQTVAVYASILIFSMICLYLQSIILQKTGQRIISHLREDLFTHI